MADGRKVSFTFDERSLVSIEELEKQGYEFKAITVSDESGATRNILLATPKSEWQCNICGGQVRFGGGGSPQAGCWGHRRNGES